jgi:hypothetical protein
MTIAHLSGSYIDLKRVFNNYDWSVLGMYGFTNNVVNLAYYMRDHTMSRHGYMCSQR